LPNIPTELAIPSTSPRDAGAAHKETSVFAQVKMRLLQEDGKAGQRFVKVLARLHLERNAVYQALTMKYYPESRLEVFNELMQRSPDCTAETLETRLAMAIDAMFSTLSAFDMSARIWQTYLAVNPLPVDQAVEVLLDFMCAGVLNTPHEERPRARPKKH
jgi:hypothetical protein